jgi:hypothetical protein
MKALARALLLLLVLALPAAAAAQASLKVLGEMQPTTGLPAGRAIQALGPEDKAGFMRAVEANVPVDAVAVLFGFGPRHLRRIQGSGGYARETAPNLLVDLLAEDGAQLTGAELERAAAFARAWMYVYQQEAVPFYRERSDVEPGSPGTQLGVRLVFERGLDGALESAMFEKLIGALGHSAGYTRTGPREIVVINLHDGDSTLLHPGLAHGESNVRFIDQVLRFTSLMAGNNQVVELRRFGALAECPQHDWAREPGGTSLLSSLDPGVRASLRALRERYEQVVAQWARALVAVR